jgi:hypothetical protein
MSKKMDNFIRLILPVSDTPPLEETSPVMLVDLAA